MVSLKDVEASNARIASAFPPGLTAVFVGGTSGIGEYALKQFAKSAAQPKIYLIGRSQESADRIIAECKKLNADGTYIYLKKDTSLLRNVDDVCIELKEKEKAINLLFLSTGTLHSKTKTKESIHLPTALVHYTRTRFMTNLLPLISTSTSLRRIITVFAATKEGPIDHTDYQALRISALAQRGHLASIITLTCEHLAKQYPTVSFIHDFPGSVKTNLVRGGEGPLIWGLKQAFKVIGPIINISPKECGERQVFLATSARYPAAQDADASKGVAVAGGVVVAEGTDGKGGSGVYSIDAEGEGAGSKTKELLAGFRKDGSDERVWADVEEQYRLVSGR